jgi:DNA modification methylase
MAKIEITKTELVWPGKYNEDGTLKEVPRVSLPFQIIETINESRATREARKGGVQGTLFDVYQGKEGDTFEEGWRNKLIWGDNLLVMGSLLEKFAGKIDLIYIDPPFATGADFSFTTEIGEKGVSVEKEQSLIEEKAYRDTWGKGADSYMDMMRSRLVLMSKLLSETGSIFVHCDWHMNARIRLLLDELFGEDRLVNEIIWRRKQAAAWSSKMFGVTNDTLLWYSRGDDYSFNPEYSKDDENTQKYIRERFVFDDGDGRKYMKSPLVNPLVRPNLQYEFLGVSPPATGWLYSRDRMEEMYRRNELVMPTKPGGRIYRKIFLDKYQGQPIQNIWTDIPIVNPMADERNGFATQKPEALLSRIVRACSDEGDLVADFFCGSGTTLAVAEKLGRRWIGCDLGRWGIHVTRKRLLGTENCKPFEVLNLGKYERQYWQGVTFAPQRHRERREENASSCLGGELEQRLYEYLAFILKLYGAQPVAGMVHLHGKKGKAMVHIGAVDAPVTIAEIDAAVDECAKLKQGELHVLGWEWEMGLYDLMVEAAKKKGVKLLLLQIPREVMEQQAAAKGDVRFFELAYLEAEVKQPKKLTAQVALTDFVIPNTELIPEDVRGKVKKWSDYIDYWAVDWDFQNDTFMQGWVAYRTRKERKLPLTSDAHTYEKPGEYRILVKVIDIFGNDTSQAFDVEVR